MKIKLVAFGIARDILSGEELNLDLNNIDSIGELKEYLTAQYNGFNELKHFRMAVNEEYREDSHPLKENDEVIIIPPVSGG